MSFPVHRPRRLRRSDALRGLVRETRLSPQQLIAPLFVCEGEGVRREIGSMPGCFHLSVDALGRGMPDARAIWRGRRDSLRHPRRRSIRTVVAASDPAGPVARGLAAVRARGAGPVPLGRRLPVRVHRSRPLRPVAERATGSWTSTTTRRFRCSPRPRVAYAEAGADVVAPSRHDGRPGRRDPRGARCGADAPTSPIVSYAAKYASALLRPVSRGRRIGARASAIAAATRWTRPTRARRCARWPPISARAPTS